MLLLLAGLLGSFDESGGIGEIHGGLVHLFMAFFVESGADANVNGEALAGLSFVNAADGSYVAIVAAAGNTNMAEANGISQRWVEGAPAAVGNEDFGPGMRSLPADDFFLLGKGCRSGSRDEIAGNIAAGQAAHADDSEQKMGEILADARLEGKGVRDRRVNMRGALDITKLAMNQAGGGLGESGRGRAAQLLGSFDKSRKSAKVGNVARGSDVVVELFTKLDAAIIEFRKGERIRSGRGIFVGEDDGFGFDAQLAMLGKNIELVDPVAKGVAIRSDAGSGSGDEAEGEAALLFIVNRAEADFVVAFGNGTVVVKLRRVNQAITIHATTA